MLPGEYMELLKEWAKRYAAFHSAKANDDPALREKEYDLLRAAVTNEARRNTEGSVGIKRKRDWHYNTLADLN